VKKTTAISLVLGLVAMAIGVWAVVHSAEEAPGAAREARTAGPTGTLAPLRFYKDPAAVPAFDVRDLDGRVIPAAGWKGKVTLVNFWATWCPPCREEIPALVALQEKYRDRLQVIGVSEDEGSVDTVRRFAEAHHINYPIVMLTPELEKTFPNVFALPTTFVVDRDVRLVQKHTGMLNAALTERETRALAGLDADAAIERVDKSQPAKLENAAQVTSVPGVDLSALTPVQRAAALQKLNTDGCTCGCDYTLAKCRVDDPSCDISLPLARLVVKAIASPE
jgi:thiol-disulfide isomerase/thioredoxin